MSLEEYTHSSIRQLSLIFGKSDKAVLTSTGTIAGTFAGSASTALKDAPAKTVTWTRSALGSWTCTTTADAKYAPSSCTPPSGT